MATTKKKGAKHKPHYIVKRAGQIEAFDSRKIYGSVYSACSITGMKERECEEVADSISRTVEKTINKRKVLPSESISKIVGQELRKRNRDAAFMYETHRDIS